jgi:hypothetical protein
LWLRFWLDALHLTQAIYWFFVLSYTDRASTHAFVQSRLQKHRQLVHRASILHTATVPRTGVVNTRQKRTTRQDAPPHTDEPCSESRAHDSCPRLGTPSLVHKGGLRSAPRFVPLFVLLCVPRAVLALQRPPPLQRLGARPLSWSGLFALTLSMRPCRRPAWKCPRRCGSRFCACLPNALLMCTACDCLAECSTVCGMSQEWLDNAVAASISAGDEGGSTEVV